VKTLISEDILYMKFIELVSFSKLLAFIQLHQSHSVHHSNCLAQLHCRHSPHLLSHIHCSHSRVHCQHSQLLPYPPIHFIGCTTPVKSPDDHFWRDPLPWSWSTGKAVLYRATLLSWLVSEHGLLP
jgi:hypothetical protein